MNLLLQFDAQITRFIAMIIPHNVVFDYFFSFLSLRGNSIIVWVIVMVLLILFEEKKDKKFIWYLLGSFFVTSIVNNNILKNVFGRPRPVFHFAAPLPCPIDFSFPSGHAAGAFSAAVILAHFDPKRKWLYYILASLVALSRIYLGCHYFLDVVGGAIVGASISYLALWFYRELSTQKKHHAKSA